MSDHDPLAQDFVQFAVECGVLRFGSFKTKAARMSPYFFNAGLFDDGAKLGRLAEFYAQRLLSSGIEFDMVFGPAYKGIPLGAALAVELARRGRNVPFAYNRKEAKDHGEGGTLVGAPLKGRVLIVDDVMSAGTATRESIAIIQAAGATPHAVLIALDRQEKATENGQDVPYSAVQFVQRQLGLQVSAIAKLGDLMHYLAGHSDAGLAEQYLQVQAYRERYGVDEGVNMTMGNRVWTGVWVTMVASIVAGAWAQTPPTPVSGVYTCIDGKGRKLTADRPIPECTDREQKVLNPSGTVKTKVGPSLTAQERADQEVKEKREIEERSRTVDERRRDRALLIRYPNKTVHDQERQEAVVQIGVVIQAAQRRLDELAQQRIAIDEEMEFYKKDPNKAPAYVRRQQEENANSQVVQRRFIGEQENEIKRVNARFDDELVRLRQLWTTMTPAAR